MMARRAVLQKRRARALVLTACVCTVILLLAARIWYACFRLDKQRQYPFTDDVINNCQSFEQLSDMALGTEKFFGRLVLGNLLVDEKHKLIWCNTPAAMSNKNLFSKLVRFARKRFFDKNSNPFHGDFEAAANVSRLTDDACWRSKLHDWSYSKILVVRNHWQRLLTSHKQFQKEWRDDGKTMSAPLEFKDFLKVVLDYFDRHKEVIKSSHLYPENMYWAPYGWYCNPCAVPYDLIIPFDSLYEDFMGISMSGGAQNGRENERTQYTKQMWERDYGEIDQMTLEAIHAFYYEDANLFNFGLDFFYPFIRARRPD